jgi:trigger factor
MQVSVEQVSAIERRLTITVPANLVEEAYTTQMNQVAKTAAIKGFRPGKAPMSYIQDRFGADVRKEAVGRVMEKALYEAISENKLQPVSTPRIEPKIVVPDQPLEFIASFEVLPTVGTVQFALANVEKLNVDVTMADVERVIERLQKQGTKWKIVDRPARDKDRVVIDYHAIIEGVEDPEKIQSFPLELGSKTTLPGFEDGLIGVVAGEQRNLHLTFPADGSNQVLDADKQALAGKPAEFVILVKQVYEAEVPPLDGQFMQQLGVKSGDVEDLKKQIKQTLERERNHIVKNKLKEQVFKALLEQNPLDVPQALIAREAGKVHDEMYGRDPEHKHQHSNKETAMFHDVARRRLALSLLVSEFVTQQDLKADPARVDQRIQEISTAYENPPEIVAWLSTKERRDDIEGQVLEDMVLDKLLENVPVTEKVMTYGELTGIVN